MRLVDADAVQHCRELVPVFGIVNALGACSEYVHLLLVKSYGKVVRNLSSRRYYHSVRHFHFYDVHYSFEGEFIEIEPVADIIIGGNRLRVVIYHDTPVSFLANGVQCLDSAPVKLHR